MRALSFAAAGLSAFFAVALATPLAPAAITDPGFTQTTLANTGFGPTGMAWAPDGSNRLFVTMKGSGSSSTVRVIKDGTLLATPFVTVNPVYSGSECGIIGIVFDPNFIVNQYVYFFVTVSNSEQQIIRYTATGDVGTAKTTVVSGLPTNGNNHDGGAVGFGPDGFLYWAIGDLGAGVGVDANLTSLAAKVGRATSVPGAAAPNDNPFFDGAGPNNDYIWARGFRNPFTFTFHPVTGQLWVNVVGTSYEQTFIVSRGDHAGYNDYENNQPAGYITPVIKYRTNGVDTRALTATGASRTSNVATFTTTGSNHGLRKGEKIFITGVTDASFNVPAGAYITSIPSNTTFTIAQTGPNATSGNGSTSTLNMGGCLNGGHFYDATQFPASYRGNYFFGDYNSGRILRAVVNADNRTIESVDYFADSINGYVDVSTGPDGAMYWASINGPIYRVAHTAVTSQALVVSHRNVRMSEGGKAAFTVRLQQAPAANVTVAVARTAGDGDVTVSAGATLTFTPANWNIPQIVSIDAANDTDTTEDSATLSVTSTGLTAETVIVRVTDKDIAGILTSTTAVTMNEGTTATFGVYLSAAPTGTLTVNLARTGDTDVTVAPATMTFTAANYNVAQTATLTAANDPDTTNDSATITLSATGLPSRTVTVTVIDDDLSAPVITSTPVTTGVVGAAYTYDVNATGTPAPTYALTSTVTGMTINATTGVISWTPTATGSYSVTVQASNGTLPNATQTYTIVVTADAAPTATLTRPTEGEVVSGTTAEFYGDGVDDVATVRAEFAIDGVLAYTDTTAGGHYHIGGTHNMWNTTLIANGPHKARMTVFDATGKSGFKEVNVVVANGGDAAVVDAAADTAVADTAVADVGDAGVVDTSTGDGSGVDTSVGDATLVETAVDDTGTPAEASTSETSITPTDDASPGADGSPDPGLTDPQTPEATGCACRTTGSDTGGNDGSTTSALLGVAIAAVVLARRRRA